MHEDPDISARDATIRSMGEIQTALIAIALVLSAVFTPMAFFGGSVGQIYRQFSITVVSSMLLSVVVALVLSPALTATLLKRRDPDAIEKGNRFVRIAHGYGDRFNVWFARTSDRYRNAVQWVIGRAWLAMGVYAIIVALLVFVFVRFFRRASCRSRTRASRRSSSRCRPRHADRNPGGGRADREILLRQGEGQRRDHLHDRRRQPGRHRTERGPRLHVVRAVGRSQGRGQRGVRDHAAREHAAGQPARRAVLRAQSAGVRGLGQSSGFTLELLNTGNLSRPEFKARRDQLIAAAQSDPLLKAVRVNALEDVPTLSVVDRRREGRRARARAVAGRRHAVGRVGRQLHQRLRRPRSRQARLRAGRRAVSLATRGPRQLVGAATRPATCRRSRRSRRSRGVRRRRR